MHMMRMVMTKTKLCNWMLVAGDDGSTINASMHILLHLRHLKLEILHGEAHSRTLSLGNATGHATVHGTHIFFLLVNFRILPKVIPKSQVIASKMQGVEKTKQASVAGTPSHKQAVKISPSEQAAGTLKQALEKSKKKQAVETLEKKKVVEKSGKKDAAAD